MHTLCHYVPMSSQFIHVVCLLAGSVSSLIGLQWWTCWIQIYFRNIDNQIMKEYKEQFEVFQRAHVMLFRFLPVPLWVM